MYGYMEVRLDFGAKQRSNGSRRDLTSHTVVIAGILAGRIFRYYSQRNTLLHPQLKENIGWDDLLGTLKGL